MYLVTTDVSKLPDNRQIVMVDGTVPKWTPKPGDLHFDHHRPGGKPIQIQEIPKGIKTVNACFVTTQVDADACAAAAWIQLQQMQLDPADEYEIHKSLSAIAYDCDHLGLPADKEWDHIRGFAARAVAALKEVSAEYIKELGLPPNRKEWSEHDTIAYASTAFERGTEWLIGAALGDRHWPGDEGEADAYFARMEEQRPSVYAACFLYRGCTVFDQRGLEGYVDPRIAVEWAREQGASNITLTIRNGANQPNAKAALEQAMKEQAARGGWQGLEPEMMNVFSYTLGCVPLHASGSPKFSDRGIWEKLAQLEVDVRAELGVDPPETAWGGRNEVGGSSWRDCAFSTYRQVLSTVLGFEATISPD
jgi:hypothetical protein